MMKVIAPLLVLIFLAAFVILFLPENSILTADEMVLNSSAFADGGMIPVNYTCDGANVSPPLSVSGVPANAKSLVLVMYDVDTSGSEYVHWVMFNIKPALTEIPQGFREGKFGFNSANTKAYTGPCPPLGDASHIYTFKLYAVGTVPIFSPREPITKKVVEEKIKSRVVEETTLTGIYQR